MIDKLPEPLAKAVQTTLEDWKSNNKVQRLRAHDASLGTHADEGKWPRWLEIVDEQQALT
jgi:transaldolase / glucose-6-phosphate isomerase